MHAGFVAHVGSAQPTFPSQLLSTTVPVHVSVVGVTAPVQAPHAANSWAASHVCVPASHVPTFMVFELTSFG